MSKGRYETRLTAKALESMNVPYFIVVEEQEVEKYAQYITRDKILTLDKRFQEEYDTCDSLETAKSKGPGAARNFAWDHSIRNGHSWHWVMDDNISYFCRLNKNTKIRVLNGAPFRAMEDFCLQYKNIGMAGPNYSFFAKRKYSLPPFVMNTRIYSCNLIRNDLPFRWRGRYNEDTDLSLMMLKARWCTVQFNAFLQNKAATQTVAGGNTADFYAKEGTLPKSTMLVKMHPDVAKLKWRFGRWHHLVDYKPFQELKLIRKDGVEEQGIPNEYGMVLKKRPEVVK